MTKPQFYVRIFHGEKSRIANAILKELKQNDLFVIKSVKTPLHLRSDEEHVYEHKIAFAGGNDEFDAARLQVVRNEILALLPDLFPINYFFKFVDSFSTSETFNYKHELTVCGIETNFKIYTKIAEQKKTSAKIKSHKIEVS